MNKKHYWEDRPEKTIIEAYGHYRLIIRYMAGCNKAQVSMEDIAAKLPLVWSMMMEDETANAALNLFKNIGFFQMA